MPKSDEKAMINDAATNTLERLSCEQWTRIISLKQRHEAGRLSLEGWRNATSAVLAGKPGRVAPSVE